MRKIDLNADLGEGFGVYGFGEDELLLKHITSANIACGFHAGDPHIMRTTVEQCLRHGAAVGAHPGLPDRLGFGRRDIAVSPEEAADFILYQIGALQAFVKAAGSRLHHVKLHGALYHKAAHDAGMAQAAARAVYDVDPELIIYGPGGSELHAAAEQIGLRFMKEGFADRAYMPDGGLASRHLPGAVLSTVEAVVKQAVSLVGEGRVQALGGGWVDMQIDTLCLHGDTREAGEHAKQVALSLQNST